MSVTLLSYLMLAFVCVHWGYLLGKKRSKEVVKSLKNKLNELEQGEKVSEDVQAGLDTLDDPVKRNKLKLPPPEKYNPFKFSKEGQKEKYKRIVFAVLLALAFSLGAFYVPNAEAALHVTMREAFHNEVSSYVTGIMNDPSNDVNVWSKILLSFLMFLAVFNEIMYYILEKLDWQRIFSTVMFIFVTLALYKGYDYGTQALWNVGQGIAGGLQTYLVGNSDNFFLSQWIFKSTRAVVLKDLGFFDGIKATVILMQWSLVCLLLDLISWLTALWADFGYALAKIIGICFVPFLMIQATRNLFDAWFKFFVGFIILNIMLRTTLVLAAITLKAVMSDLGVKFAGDYGDPVNVVRFGIHQFTMLSDGIAMLFIAILFVFSSFTFASAVASGVGNMSGGLGQLSNMVSRKLVTKFL